MPPLRLLGHLLGRLLRVHLTHHLGLPILRIHSHATTIRHHIATIRAIGVRVLRVVLYFRLIRRYFEAFKATPPVPQESKECQSEEGYACDGADHNAGYGAA